MALVPKVAIVYLSFHSEPYLDDVVAALQKMTYPKDRVELVIVDNPHPTHGSSVRFIEETVLPLSCKELPHVPRVRVNDPHSAPVRERNAAQPPRPDPKPVQHPREDELVPLQVVDRHGDAVVVHHHADGRQAATTVVPLANERHREVQPTCVPRWWRHREPHSR